MSDEEPDWDGLSRSASEMQRLIRAGEWTKKEFQRLYVEQMKLARGDETLLSDLFANAEDDWLE